MSSTPCVQSSGFHFAGGFCSIGGASAAFLYAGWLADIHWMAREPGGLMKIPVFHPNPLARSDKLVRSTGATAPRQSGSLSLEARVKPDCVHIYPGVDPRVWYKVVQEGEYRDEMEGLWIQVSDWVTYVLAKHFDVQSLTAVH